MRLTIPCEVAFACLGHCRPEQTAEWNEVKFLQVSFLFSTRRTSCQPCERSVGVQLKIPRTERRSHAAHAREAISISRRGHIHIHITRNVFDTAEHTCSLSISQSTFSDFSVRSRFCLGLILLTVSAVIFRGVRPRLSYSSPELGRTAFEFLFFVFRNIAPCRAKERHLRVRHTAFMFQTYEYFFSLFSI